MELPEKIKINNLNVINPNEKDNREILHKNLVNCKYPILLLCGKKGSGKSWLLYNILMYSVLINNPGCNIFIFSWSINKDPVYKKLIKKFEKYKFVKLHLYEDIIINGVNILNWVIDKILTPEKQNNMFNDETLKLWNKNKIKEKEEEKIPYEKLPFIAWENIFIIDDMSHLLKNIKYKEWLSRLASTNRHMKSMVIMCIHKYKEVLPVIIRENANILILFRGYSKEKLETIFSDCWTRQLDFKTMYKCYMDATENPYNFFYLNLDTWEMRKNFNEQYLISF